MMPRHFTQIRDKSMLDSLFQDLKIGLYSRLDQGFGWDTSAIERGDTLRSQAPYFRESGRLAQDRSYVFIKASGHVGWLFERMDNGWIMVQASKIAGRNLFIRETEPADWVSVYMCTSDASLSPRVQAEAFGDSLIPMQVYLDRLGAALATSLGSEPGSRQIRSTR